MNPHTAAQRFDMGDLRVRMERQSLAGELRQHGRREFGVFLRQDGAAFDQGDPRPEPQQGLRQGQPLKARAHDDEVLRRPIERHDPPATGPDQFLPRQGRRRRRRSGREEEMFGFDRAAAGVEPRRAAEAADAAN